MLTNWLLAAAVAAAQAPPAPVDPAAVPFDQRAPDAPPADSPDEIARDSARDLDGDSFYNRPGATRADYDRDWQACRLIARGSRTPGGSVPYFYNPAVVSPLAAGIGAGIGGLIGGMIVQGQQRRANRAACLLVRGWRKVELSNTDAAALKALPAAEREARLLANLGAAEVRGDKVIRWNNDWAEPKLAIAK